MALRKKLTVDKPEPYVLDIPAGMATRITIETADERHTSADPFTLAAAKAEAEAEAEDTQKATGLDLLRMRGTPIELIYSALLAKDDELTQSACRTTVLEYLYETLVERWPGTRVSFVNDKAVPATSEQPRVIHAGANRRIHDDGTATVLQLIEGVTRNVESVLRTRHPHHSSNSVPSINIVTNNSHTKIVQSYDVLSLTAHIALLVHTKPVH